MDRIDALHETQPDIAGHAAGDGRAEFSWRRAPEQAYALLGPLPLVALLDELSFGVAVVDVDARLVHASRAARMQLQAQRGLRIQACRIEAESAADEAALVRALAAAAAGRRSYLAVGRANHRMDVAILPLDSIQTGGEPFVVLVFEKAAGSGGLGLYFFAQAYGLTRTEQSVLAELGDGASVVDAARQLGSSVHTVRTHVRNILCKTGQANLRGLTRRIGMLPPVGARFAIAHARGEAFSGGASASAAAIGPTRVAPTRPACAACALAA